MVSKVDICNLALSRLGDKRTVEDIDNAQKNEERIFKKWYDITRQSTIKKNMPTFAMVREKWAKSDQKPAFGYSNAYKYHNDCLRILGVGSIGDGITDYVIEDGYLMCDEYFPDGIPVRYLKDVKDTTRFSSNFIELLSFELAYNVCAEVTESSNMLSYIEQILPSKRLEFSAIDSQENKPVRITRSIYNRTGKYVGKK